MRFGNLEVPLLTRDDLRAELRSDDYRDWPYRDLVAGPIELGSDDAAKLFGPDNAYVWDLRRLTITGLDGSDTIELYRNDPTPAGLITRLVPLANFFFPTTIVVYSGNELWMKNTTGHNVTLLIGGLVHEVPLGCDGKWL